MAIFFPPELHFYKKNKKIREPFFKSKKGLLPMGILIFFLKIPPILKIEVGFFSDRKTFAQNVFPGKFYYFGTNYERSFKRFAEPFFSQKTPDFGT